MDQCDVVEKPLQERVESELEADPDLCSVTFSVGPQKTKVKALKVILLAASPALKKEFKTKWENAVGKDGEGIPLPDFDGDSFQLFIKLTSLDTWSVKVLEKLDLCPNRFLDLLHICRRYEIRKAVTSLEKFTAAFIQSFTKFKDTAEFLELSQANLKEVLASDDLPLEETEVFKCALRWAEWKCKERKIEASMGNLRHFLGDCIFEIRFPTMSQVDFTNAMKLKELLSEEEIAKIYKYVGLGALKRQTVDVRGLGFKAKRRNPILRVRNGPSTAQLQPASFTLSLLSKSRKIEAKIPFVCDGSRHGHLFFLKQGMALLGLGFAGPIDSDAFYEVTVDIKERALGKSFTDGPIKKSIFAIKAQRFYFLFDDPVIVKRSLWSRVIEYILKGPNTSSIIGGHDKLTTIREGSNEFKWWFISNQLTEILFKIH